MFRNTFFLVITTIIFSCSSQNDRPHFKRTTSDSNTLNGHWYLIEKIIPEINSRDSIFSIDTSSYQGKKITIDVRKMLFSSELYPYNSVPSKYRMVITHDSLKVRSGAFQNGKALYKNSFTFMLSDDAKHLRIYHINENEIEIYFKR